MPVTPFQSEVLAVLAGNRSEESHFAGGLVLNASPESARYSDDFDIFHETAAEVARASEMDAASLRAAGFAVEPKWPWEKPTSFRKAVVSRSGESVEIDWAADSAFRFFPIERDPVLGWRLHLFDMATKRLSRFPPVRKRGTTSISWNCMAFTHSPQSAGPLAGRIPDSRPSRS